MRARLMGRADTLAAKSCSIPYKLARSSGPFLGSFCIVHAQCATINDRFEEAGKLEVVPVDEEAIKEDDRVPRVTSATWFVYVWRISSY